MIEIIVAALSLVGTLCGSLTGVLVANRLTNYRIEQLEKKVDKHNTVIERTGLLEKETEVINHRLKELEDIMKELEVKALERNTK